MASSSKLIYLSSTKPDYLPVSSFFTHHGTTSSAQQQQQLANLLPFTHITATNRSSLIDHLAATTSSTLDSVKSIFLSQHIETEKGTTTVNYKPSRRLYIGYILGKK